jgi:predicted RNA-binding protein associated with RNAse of E/G family
MYPLIRVDKLHPDRTPRAAWQAYRIDDVDTAVRLFAPSRTHRIHVNGHWIPDSPILTTWRPGDPYVIASWEESDATELYVDIIREATVTASRFAYVDLYVDVTLRNGNVSSKDEELLRQLDADEARRVLEIRGELMEAMRAGEPPFTLDDARWQVPMDARALPPGAELALA